MAKPGRLDPRDNESPPNFRGLNRYLPDFISDSRRSQGLAETAAEDRQLGLPGPQAGRRDAGPGRDRGRLRNRQWGRDAGTGRGRRSIGGLRDRTWVAWVGRQSHPDTQVRCSWTVRVEEECGHRIAPVGSTRSR